MVAAVLLLWPFQEIVSFLKIVQVFDNAENWNLVGHAIGGAIFFCSDFVAKARRYVSAFRHYLR